MATGGIYLTGDAGFDKNASAFCNETKYKYILFFKEMLVERLGTFLYSGKNVEWLELN